MHTPDQALLVMPTSSTEHSAGELDRHHPHPPLTVIKRKRTKRPRHHPPASSSASSSESTTTEEEDMAHCLILLAQGASSAGGHAAVDSKPKSERYTSRKYTEAVTTEDGVKAGFYVYECKTCNKCFPTFQALGGHRASHKKPRIAVAGTDEEVATTTTMLKPPMMAMPTLTPPPVPQTTIVFPDDVTTALSLNTVVATTTPTKQLRVHECSICGAEFASGQALGGHMRRHRPLNAPERAVTAIAADTTKKEAGINLELDLNLPAPSDDEEALSLPAPPAVVLGLGQFISDGNKAAGLMLTASALVDCHY